MRGFGRALRDAWRLTWPYFRSEERRSAILLLASIVALNLMLVGADVVLNFWRRGFYNTLQNKDAETFWSLLFMGKWDDIGVMPGFVLILLFYVPVSIYSTYLNQWLQIRWRRWLTSHLLDGWLSDRAYYRIQLAGDPAGTGTDNPDQRIADDVDRFVDDTLSLGIGFVSTAVNMVSFLSILWTLSGALTLQGFTIPGYLVWTALVYAALGTAAVHFVGRPLVALNFNKQRYDADFRFNLVRVRENAEGVALYAGEGEEKRGLLARFSNIVANWYGIMWQTKLLNATTTVYNYIAGVFPIAVTAPRFFRGEVDLGGLFQITGAFSQVQTSLSWFISSYNSLASWRATVVRLTSFTDAVAAARQVARDGLVVETPPAGTAGDLELHDVELDLPTGGPLLVAPSVRFPRGRATLVQGRSGSGKSTLFRALAGIWPFGHGRVGRPAGTALFLPQRPYFPLGTLRHVVAYPAEEGRFTDGQVRQALADAGLPHLSDRLDLIEPWGQRLSGGEQQRLAFARALLQRPDWLFLDEATASLDPEGERALYQTLRAKLPGTSIVSIAHSPAVAEFHDARMVVTPAAGGGPGRLAPA